MKNNKEKETLKEIQPDNDFIKLDESSTDNKNSDKVFETDKRIQFDFSLDSQKEKNDTKEEKHIEILNNKNSLNSELEVNKQNYKDLEYKSEEKLNSNSQEVGKLDTLDESVCETLVIYNILI